MLRSGLLVQTSVNPRVEDQSLFRPGMYLSAMSPLLSPPGSPSCSTRSTVTSLTEDVYTEVTLDDALEEISLGRFHGRLLLVCGLGWLADSAWMQAVILTSPPIVAEFGTNAMAGGLLLTFLFAGQTAGAVWWGPVSDRSGRKFAFTTTLACAGLFGLLATLTRSWLQLAACLFATGFGVGGNLPVDGCLFAELMPRSHRGRYMVFLSVFWSVGAFTSSLLAWAFIPSYSCVETVPAPCPASTNFGWRLVFGCLGLLNFGSLALRSGFPESPAYLLGRGDAEGAMSVLRDIATTNGKDWPPPSLGQPVRLISAALLNSDGPGAACGERFHNLLRGSQMRRTTSLLAAVWFLSNLGYGVFNASLPSRTAVGSDSQPPLLPLKAACRAPRVLLRRHFQSF